MTEASIEPFTEAHLDVLVSLVAAEGWTEYADDTGRWTTYGELAELGGTAAVPVGVYITGLPPGTNAYRVLTANGSVSEGFDWLDPGDNRDVHEVLEAEGIHFEEGYAAPDQRMTAEELAALIGEPEDQLDEATGLDQAA
jgi:alkylated DNA nucleotide flippase Atl1